jgi:hypothetical protein
MRMPLKKKKPRRKPVAVRELITGKAVRARLDRPARRNGGRTVRFADGGVADYSNVEPPPGSDRLNYKEPGINSMGVGGSGILDRPDIVDAQGYLRQITPDEAQTMLGKALVRRGADLLGLPGDIERPLDQAVDWVGTKLGHNPGLSQRPVFPTTEDIQRQYGLRKQGGGGIPSPADYVNYWRNFGQVPAGQNYLNYWRNFGKA